MKRIFALALFLAASVAAHAQSPRMTVRQADGTLKTLSIEEAEISVRILGDVAETVVELDFRNDGERAVEGEFALPLPAGATVSGYALEVNGSMRSAVAVEKERARTAYETVKRRLIDPGIVEREAGNIYRTKVYPVPAKGTKRLRISYTETLRGEVPVYTLPLDFPAAVASFTLRVEGAGLDIKDKAGAVFTEEQTDVSLAEMKSFKPSGTLRIETAAMPDDALVLDDGPEPAFMISTVPPELAPRKRPAPKSIAIIWDASGSGLVRDHAAELALLDAWFGKLGVVSVRLFTLRDVMEDAGGFEVRGGKWEKLRETLENLDYDGATDFSQVVVPGGKADLVLLVSDGVASIAGAAPKIAGPWFFIHPENPSAASQLGHLAQGSGGDEIVLGANAHEAGLEKLTQVAPRLISVTGLGVKEALTGDTLVRGQRLHVFGTMKGRDFGTLELGYGFSEEITTRRTVTPPPEGKPGGMIRRLHAQRALAEMERKMPVDREAIIAHCKREGLVSDFTSLIVLERLEDYAEHGIRPPEEELWQEYNKLVADHEERAKQRPHGPVYPWHTKLAWHGSKFPGYEVGVLPRLKQVGIWKYAVEKQFQPEQRDAEAFGVIAGWYGKGIALLERIPAIRTQEEYDAWRNEIDALEKQGPLLASTPLDAPPAGKDLEVSVRGLVAQPGVVTSGKAMTLRGAIAMAGGPHPMGSLDNVSLYRNAGKVVYNTLSEAFEDFPLFPMDMVVIGTLAANDFDDVDPFSDGGVPLRAGPAGQTPIRGQDDVWVRPSGNSDPFATLDSGSSMREENGGVRTVTQEEVSEEIPDATVFEKQLAAGTDPETAYREHRGAVTRPQRFYVDAARLLFSRKQDALAKRVLSNLSETRPGNISALRSEAFWLAEFGRTRDAEKLLEGVSADVESKVLIDRDLASIRGSRGNFDKAYATWSRSMGDITGAGDLMAIILTEFNSLRVTADGSGVSEPFPGYESRFSQPLPADIRIVMTAADEAARLKFTVLEPDGFRCPDFSTGSPSGGRVGSSRGVSEYMIRRAVPGTYRIECATDVPTTVRLTIHTDWSRPNQTTRVLTLFPDTAEPRAIADVEFGFRAAE